MTDELVCSLFVWKLVTQNSFLQERTGDMDILDHVTVTIHRQTAPMWVLLLESLFFRFFAFG